LVRKVHTPGTLERYTTSLKHTVEFMKWKYNITDIDIMKIDHAFITNYEFWLKNVRNCANNTAVKYIKNFNKIIKICWPITGLIKVFLLTTIKTREIKFLLLQNQKNRHHNFPKKL
jgi:hypothetical protein